MKMLVVEDERRMAKLLCRGLEEEGHSVQCAFDGADGLRWARTQTFDVVILDVMLPKIDGFEVARTLRSEEIDTPVLMLTAKDAVADVVNGLDLGADDYMTKPFSFNELLARMQAIERRAVFNRTRTLHVSDLVLNPTDRSVFRNNRRILLTRTEYQLLECLMTRAGRVVPRHWLIESVWGPDRAVEENTLDAFMRLLRHKIDGDGQVKLIQTVRGVGYEVRDPQP